MKTLIKTVNCDKCGIVFSKRIHLVKPTRYNYCSNLCRHADSRAAAAKWSDDRKLAYSQQISGENNPNYGKTWSDEKRKDASLKKIQFFKDRPEVAYECGKTNRGKKLTQEEIQNWHRNKVPIKHTEETRFVIGKLSKEKWTDEFKEKFRKTKEELGQWIPLGQKTEFELYYKEADWISSMFDYMSEEDINRIKEIGIFNAKTNKNGLVRDHIVSRVTGFNYKIPAELIRHPANMQIMSHSANARKGHLDKKLDENRNKELISNLIKKIQDYDKHWIEQEKCYDCICVLGFTL